MINKILKTTLLLFLSSCYINSAFVDVDKKIVGEKLILGKDRYIPNSYGVWVYRKGQNERAHKDEKVRLNVFKNPEIFYNQGDTLVIFKRKENYFIFYDKKNNNDFNDNNDFKFKYLKKKKFEKEI